MSLKVAKHAGGGLEITDGENLEIVFTAHQLRMGTATVHFVDSGPVDEATKRRRRKFIQDAWTAAQAYIEASGLPTAEESVASSTYH